MRKGGRGREDEREGGREGGIERERERNHAHMHMHFSSARTILGKVVAVWHRDVAALAQPGNGVAIAAAAPVPAAEALQKFSKVSAQVHSLSRVTIERSFQNSCRGGAARGPRVRRGRGRPRPPGRTRARAGPRRCLP